MISQSNISDKQNAILNAALALFVENGFHGTPTSKIAATAGVSNGTLFHYYKTKEDLIVALYIYVKSSMSACINMHDSVGSVEERFRFLFTFSLDWALKNKQAFYYMQQIHFSPHLAQVGAEIIESQSRPYKEFILEAIKQGSIKKRKLELIISLINSHVFGLYQYLTLTELSPVMQKKTIEEGFEMVWGMLKK